MARRTASQSAMTTPVTLLDIRVMSGFVHCRYLSLARVRFASNESMDSVSGPLSPAHSEQAPASGVGRFLASPPASPGCCGGLRAGETRDQVLRSARHDVR